MGTYKDLTTWQKAYTFTLSVYEITRNYPKEELFGLVSQMRRAASSIPVNIAEGSMRRSKKEFRRFIRIAQGSMAEMEVWIKLSFDLKYINKESFNQISFECDEVGKLLEGLARSLKQD
ncbi:four helix bundle protein [candidate division LCP-89 bacterium B3_LCP]|uniref:Four helix bundle protein n=1 Tax=candidate division LCP-89 bacterium B3_LCP TaxID=2012998 RepID=A0A532UYQ9_UNCL8|nr:MAG: four helix bundle protein [candidate division LCP-89 bacterium B3_LCP]